MFWSLVSALYLNGKKLDVEQFSRRARRVLTDVAWPQQDDDESEDAVAELETLVQQLETQYAAQERRLQALLQQRRFGGVGPARP